MNIEKFTERAKGFLQSAQTVALRNNHQRVQSEHLLKALLEDEQGMAAGLIRAAGGRPEQATQAVDLALTKVPQVTGGGAGKHMVYLSGVTDHHIDDAQMVDHIVALVATEAAEIEAAIDGTAAAAPVA